VWSNFDQRRKAKSANDGDSLIADDGEDMFKAAGIAAE
jgi:hypothetical protein